MPLMVRLGVSLTVLTLVAACNQSESPTSPSPSTQVHYGAVGASDAIGFGGSVPCLPFDGDCPGGTGYVYLVKRRFQTDGSAITLSNRGIPGAVISPAFLTLARDIGRSDILGTFLDQIVPFVPTGVTHVSIFAGGNDANVIAQNVRAGRAGSDIAGFVDTHVRQFGVDVTELVSRLRARSASARLVALNLPNLAAMPYVAGLSIQERSILQRIAVGISDRINALTAQNVIVVDLMCDPRSYTAANFSSDGYHPNDGGYAVMAELLYTALRNGSSSTPSTSCPQRVLLPTF